MKSNRIFKLKKSLHYMLTRKKAIILALLLAPSVQIFAQGQQGIQAATSEILSYTDSVGDLVIAVGAIVGFVGAIRVFVKWQNGDQDTQKSVMGWMGACIFLIVSGVVVKAFFGV